MTLTKVAVLAVALLIASLSRAAETPLTPLAFLAGQCWKGEFAEGGSFDRHCFEWAYDGKFLRDRHVVTGKRGPYSGESIYRFDAKAQRIVFHYFDSTGGYSEGRVEPAASELRFPEERYHEGQMVRTLRTLWRREGPDRFVAITEELKGDMWTEAWRIGYSKDK